MISTTTYRVSFRPPPAPCPCCGRDRTSLLDLPRVGTQSDGGEVILLVNEPCGTTRAIVLIPHPADVLERLGLDEEVAA